MEDVKRNEDGVLQVLMHSEWVGEFWKDCTQEEEQKIKNAYEKLNKEVLERDKILKEEKKEIERLKDELETQEGIYKSNLEKLQVDIETVDKFSLIFLEELKNDFFDEDTQTSEPVDYSNQN